MSIAECSIDCWRKEIQIQFWKTKSDTILWRKPSWPSFVCRNNHNFVWRFNWQHERRFVETFSNSQKFSNSLKFSNSQFYKLLYSSEISLFFEFFDYHQTKVLKSFNYVNIKENGLLVELFQLKMENDVQVNI